MSAGIDVTERRRAEAERERLLAQVMAQREAAEKLAETLQRERDTLQAIMENTRSQVAYLDREFRFVRVNSSYEQGSGHRREELLGRNHFDLFPNAENQAIFEQVRDTGKPMEYRAKPFEFVDQPERGVTYWDWTLAPVKDAAGQVQGLVLSLADVTHQVQDAQDREKLLAENRTQRDFFERQVEEQNAVYAAMAEALVVYDAGGTPVNANPAAMATFGERLLGADRAQLAQAVHMHRPDGRTLAPEDFPVSRALRGQRVTGEHLVFTDAHGQERTILVSATPLFIGGQLSGAVAAWHDITNEERVEQALRESEEKLRTLFEILPVGVSVLDQQRRVQSANPALSRILGLSPDELLSGSYGRRTYLGADGKEFPPGDFPSVRAFDEQRLIQDVEIGIVKEEGELIWTSVSAAPLPFSDWRVIVATADITERKRVEQTLQRYARQQTSLYTVASAVSATLDRDELLPLVLDAVLRALGACAGWALMPYPSPGDPPRVVAQRGVCEGLLAETTLPVEDCPLYRALSPEGDAPTEPQPVVDCPALTTIESQGPARPNLVCVPLYAGNRLQGVLKIGWREPHPDLQQDHELLLAIGRQVGVALHNAQLFQTARQLDRLQALSDLDRALAATFDLRRLAEETMQRVRLYLDVPAAAIFLLQPTDQTRPAQEMFTSAGAWEEVAIADRDWARWQVFLGRLSNQPEPVDFGPEEFGLASHDSEVVRQWQRDAIVVPIRGERSFLALLALGGRGPDRPLTEEDRALAAVAASHAGQAMQNAQLYNELRGLLAERERTRAQLIQSEKLAALGRLSASIAHEINNPLQAIANCLTLAREEIDGSQRHDKLDRYLGIVGGEVGRISGIVRQMRDYYRPAHERLQPTDMSAVLDSVLDLSGKELQHHNVTVERSGSLELPQIQANPDHLKQVLLNLVLNAMEAMPDGGMLRIRTGVDQLKRGVDQHPQPAIRIDVSDTGRGMSSETLAHLFEPFFTTKEQGAGLGLYITYSIIEAHNGQISVASEPGAGTAFTILLPVTQP